MVDLKSFLDIPRSENLVLAAVCTDAENINDVKEIVKNLGIDYPVLLDRNANVSRLYKASLLPETVVIDQTQYITFIRQGYDTNIAKQLRTKVAALLASDEGIK